MFFNKPLRGIAFLIIIVGVTIGIVAYDRSVYYHFRTVDAGKLYRSGTLSKTGLERIYKKIHFRTIILLRDRKEIIKNENNWYGVETAFCQIHNINLINIPLGPESPPTAKQVKEFLDIVSLSKNLPVLVHCSQGVTRTGMLVAVYEIAILRKNNKEVFDSLPRFGHDELELGPQNFILNFNLEKTLRELDNTNNK